MSKIPITSARLVSDGQVTGGDLLIEHGRIARVGGQIRAGSGSRGSLIKCNPAV